MMSPLERNDYALRGVHQHLFCYLKTELAAPCVSR